MGMTMTQKILAQHAGLPEVRAGQLIQSKLDLVLGNDITTPVAINEFEAAGFDTVFDKSKIALVMDHFVPNKDIKAATQCQQCRNFARRFDIDHYYDVGTMGIEHALLPEQGLVAPGEAVIGAVPIPALTARWARSPRASAPPTWARLWRRVKRGSKSPPRFGYT